LQTLHPEMRAAVMHHARTRENHMVVIMYPALCFVNEFQFTFPGSLSGIHGLPWGGAAFLFSPSFRSFLL